MKLKLLIASIFFFSFATVQAQKFSLGIKGGANINKLTGSSFKDEFSYGFHLGGFAQIGLGKKFAIQPEVLFTQTNVDTVNNFNQINSSSLKDARLSYLSIPLLLNYKVNKLLTLQAGPQFGVLIDKSKNILQNGEDAFKAGDFSLLGGVQLNLSSFKVYARYAVGLNNLNEIDDQDKWKSQSIQLGVGLRLF
ncbi:porin family protein [Ferruginibacter sp. SUN002]|uniref:porin family protein n=1 Tax=Ferruginibacter sp. SUN002 TaxID=2937789 RepID=UPI003D362F52